MPASVSVRALDHAYGDHRVVRDMSFHLQPGRIGCLLGPSGCGKTTVLRCLAGFEPVQGGEIVNGNPDFPIYGNRKLPIPVRPRPPRSEPGRT